MKNLPKSISIIIPAYNEASTIEECLRRVIAAPKRGLDFEVIISDGLSTDGTREILEKVKDPKVKVIFRDTRSGKGINLRSAIPHATGDIILWQDADLEYNPNDYQDVLEPFFETNADVVYGSRFTRAKYVKVFRPLNFFANKVLTWPANLIYSRIFTDIETATKVFRRETLNSLELVSDGFEIEPEITAKLCKKNVNIFEVPISHSARGYEDGKKIRWWHFFTSLWSLIKWKFIS